MRTVAFDFTRPEGGAGTTTGWTPIDDRVMGGVSRSRLGPADDDGSAVFTGTVSLDRNGGFASVRSPLGHWDFEGLDEVWIEVCGDGQRYKLSVFTDDAFDGVAWQADFVAGPAWQRIAWPLAAFVPRFRGREVAGLPLLQAPRIRQFGLMIAQQQAGPFRLKLKRIGLARSGID